MNIHEPFATGAAPGAGHGTTDRLSRRRPLVLAVVLLAVLLVSIDNSILYVALKTLAEPKPTGLGASQSQLQWAVDAYTLTYAGFLLSAGVIGNRTGHKRLLLAGLLGFAALSAYAQNPAQLIAYRAAMGLSAALIMPATLAIVTHVFPGEARAQAIGIWSAVVGAALAIGPLIAGALLAHFWWGSVFLVKVPLVALAVPAIWLLVPELGARVRRRLDPAGVVLAAAGLLGVVYGIIRAGDLDTWNTAQAYLPIAAGILLLGGFVTWERRVNEPTLDMGYFKNRGFDAAAIALALLFFALFGGTFVMIFYLQSIRGYSALRAGVCILPLAGAMIAFAPQAPALVRKFGARTVSTIGMLAVAAAALALANLHRTTAIWQLELILFIFGAGMAHVLPPTTTQIVATLPEDEAGTSSAINNTFRQIGGSIGIAVLGSTLASSYRTSITPTLQALPAPIRSHAGSSITTTLQALHAAGSRAQQLVPAAENAFIHAMHITWLAAAIILFAGALLVFLITPAAQPDELRALQRHPPP